MSSSKTKVFSEVDLGEFERRLLAAHALPRGAEDPLSELTRLVSTIAADRAAGAKIVKLASQNPKPERPAPAPESTPVPVITAKLEPVAAPKPEPAFAPKREPSFELKPEPDFAASPEPAVLRNSEPEPELAFAAANGPGAEGGAGGLAAARQTAGPLCRIRDQQGPGSGARTQAARARAGGRGNAAATFGGSAGGSRQ